jgi:cytochrome c oxidase cbb3-type subunit I/II
MWIAASSDSTAPKQEIETFVYDDKIVRLFAAATVLWGLVAFAVGGLISILMVAPTLTENVPWLAFGRLRPLHTNAAIYAFLGNAVFAAVYFSTQRLCKTRMWSDALGYLHFWGWQAIIAASIYTLPLGITQGRAYAELEWPIDLAIASVWFLFFGVNFFGTLAHRRERHLYVAIWFYIATIIAIGLMHLLNNVVLPIDSLASVPWIAGAYDAIIDGCYGYNAVSFLLTMPFLGLMYYYLPKAANQAIYSYKLSIVHFWSLLLIYLGSSPLHSHYTSMPEWLSTLGMLFGLLLWMPSWGGLVNGLLTLRGASAAVAKDPVLKFFFAALLFYGLGVFDSAMMSIKSVNALTMYSDWTVAHLHVMAMGWCGLVTFGMLYWLIPRIFQTPLFSQSLMAWHFWMSVLGIVLFILPSYAAGILQSQMLRATDENGLLVYPEFIETTQQIIPLWKTRILGGLLYGVGILMLGVNLAMTWKSQPLVRSKTVQSGPAAGSIVEEETETATCSLAEAPVLEIGKKLDVWSHLNWHRRWERLPLRFVTLTCLIFLAAAVFKLGPVFLLRSNVPLIASVKPYTPLELAGRHLYVAEGCVNCHTQQVRPLVSETKRYGDYSQSGEFAFDRPFQWGERRIGPDLARVGGKWGSFWHWSHLGNPAGETDGSVMPSFKHLLTTDLKFAAIEPLMRAAKRLGSPYSDDELENFVALAQQQAEVINAEIVSQGGPPVVFDKQAIALIAYLQRLGTDISRPATPPSAAVAEVSE